MDYYRYHLATILRGPSSAPLTVIGKFSGQLQKGIRLYMKILIFVVKNLHSPILGHPAIETLQLVMQIQPVTATDTPVTKDTVMQQFPSLFGKLGKLKGLYHIALKKSATPFSLNTPR